MHIALLMHTSAEPPCYPSLHEHGNDFVFYSAVEPDSLIAFFGAFGIFVLRLHVTVEFS